jgi:hypothetical protein
MPSSTAEAPTGDRGLEHVDPGVALVDDGERQVLVVGAGQHPGAA